MDKLPENIKRIDILKIEYAIEKLCKCRFPKYTIDYQNRLVYCQDCGAIIDPFDALKKLAQHYDRVNEQVRGLLNQAKEIQKYKPHIKVIKSLESSYRSGKMVPNCPHCHKAFDLKDLTGWSNRDYCDWQVKTDNDTEEGV